MQEHTRELDIRALLYTMFQKKKYFIYSYLVVGLVLAVFMNYEINVRPTYLSDTIIYVSMQNSTNTDTETDTITSTELNNMKR
jgi:capsular polysaccharide biosynthesis protein